MNKLEINYPIKSFDLDLVADLRFDVSRLLDVHINKRDNFRESQIKQVLASRGIKCFTDQEWIDLAKEGRCSIVKHLQTQTSHLFLDGIEVCSWYDTFRIVDDPKTGVISGFVFGERPLKDKSFADE